MPRTIRLLLFVLTVLIACQTNSSDPQPRLFGEFYVRYLAPERLLRAEATFLKGDSIATAQPHAFEGGVAFQGSNMNARRLSDKLTRYQYEQLLAYPEKARFSFKPDPEKDPVNLNCSMSPLGNFSIPGGISRQSGFTLLAEGSRLTEDESLVLLFADPNNKASTIILKGPSKSDRHVFQGKQVADFAMGPHQLYLVKKKVTARDEERITAQITMEYFSDVLEVEVQP
jgi:hypothetical protein